MTTNQLITKIGRQRVITALSNVVCNVSGGSGAVDSVNGQTGVVVLDAGDVGADPAGSAAAAQAASQPLDTDLTEIAALNPAALESIRRNAADNAWETFAPAAALGYTPPRILYINTVADSFTGSAAETLRPNYSFTIAGGTLAVGDLLQFFLITTKTGTTDTNTTRVYFNTSQTLVGATMIGMYTQAASQQFQTFTRKIRITGTTTQEFFNAALSGNPTDDIAVNSAQSTASFNIANDIHFCTAVDLSGTPSDTVVLRGLVVLLYR